jgi:hypothetical protein
MAREIVAWCDVHMKVGERQPARTFTLDIGRGPRELDLCEVHEKELISPLADALEDFGAKPIAPASAVRRAANGPKSVEALASASVRHGKRPTNERAHPCPFCPLDYTTMTSVVTHCRNKHGFASDATTADIFGRICPLCAAGGYDVMSSHAQQTHELGSVAALFAAAKEAGDEFGVVAERTALADNVMLG